MATLNTLWARAIVQELQRGGVRQAVLCPGSRNAPLVLALAGRRTDVPLATWCGGTIQGPDGPAKKGGRRSAGNVVGARGVERTTYG